MSKYDYLTYEDLYRAVKQCGSKRATARFLKIPWSSFCELWDRKVLGKVKGAESGEIHRIGIMSDTHIGSLYDQIDNVRDFVNKCEEMECEIILHSGDICDGIDMRPYHEYEIYLHTLDEIEEGIISSLPEIGIPYYLITGNHDHSIFKKLEQILERGLRSSVKILSTWAIQMLISRSLGDCGLECITGMEDVDRYVLIVSRRKHYWQSRNGSTSTLKGYHCLYLGTVIHPWSSTIILG